MKIGIDISQVVYETGVSVYTNNLVSSLARLDNKNQYKLFAGSLRRRGDIRNFLNNLRNKNFKAVVFPLPPTFLQFLWNNLHKFEIENFIGEVDVFHSSDWTQPPSRAKKVTTIHDLTPILYPQWSLPNIIEAHKRRLGWVKKEVDAIIAPTESTKKDLVSLGFDKKTISVISEAPEKIFTPSSVNDIKNTKTKLDIKGKYILSIGVSPRKNLKNSIKAFHKFKKKNKNLKMVVVGYKYQDLEMNEDIIYTGHVDKELLPHLYSGAELLLYPSLYEGFGLPILESMACGTPVVTSNRSSMSEVAGDSAVLVNPDSIEDIQKGIKNALKDKIRLIDLGKKRIKKYSWEKAAQETIAVYKSLV